VVHDEKEEEEALARAYAGAGDVQRNVLQAGGERESLPFSEDGLQLKTSNKVMPKAHPSTSMPSIAFNKLPLLGSPPEGSVFFTTQSASKFSSWYIPVEGHAVKPGSEAAALTVDLGCWIRSCLCYEDLDSGKLSNAMKALLKLLPAITGKRRGSSAVYRDAVGMGSEPSEGSEGSQVQNEQGGDDSDNSDGGAEEWEEDRKAEERSQDAAGGGSPYYITPRIVTARQHSLVARQEETARKAAEREVGAARLAEERRQKKR
jgi:hypothetical protein